jgi:hypothetical protein
VKRFTLLFTFSFFLFSVSLLLAPAATHSSDLPLAAQAAIPNALRRDDAAYHLSPMANGYRPANVRQRLTARF